MYRTLSIKQVELLFKSRKVLLFRHLNPKIRNMEHVGAISEGEWSSLNGMCSEEAELMAQLLGNCSFPSEAPSNANLLVSSTFWPAHESDGNIGGADETNTSMHSFSQGSSYGGGSSILFPFSSHECCYPSVYHQVFVSNNNPMTMDFCMMEDKNNSSRVHILGNDVIGGEDFLNQDVSNDSTESNSYMSENYIHHGKKLEHGRRLAVPVPEVPTEEKVVRPSESKKRSRVPGEAQRSKRGVRLSKCPKVDDSDEDNNNNNNNKNNNVVLHRQNSSSCCSGDDSNASHEMNGVASSSSSKGSRALNGKTRANRGSATDPQSLYARKRRERINERLRILQNLVPNGTKVDISTMLEEAVQYVKFLQLQIKLLSSDDLWMYAPIAYNGMDIGLDLKISTPKPLP